MIITTTIMKMIMIIAMTIMRNLPGYLVTKDILIQAN